MTPADLLDLPALQNLVDLDDGACGLVAEMTAIFRDDTPRRLRDIRAAIEDQDAESLSRAAHALKGCAGAIGAKALRLLAADLEAQGRGGTAAVAPDAMDRLQRAYEETLVALEAYCDEHRA